MAIKSATRASKLTVQPLPPTLSSPSVGSLPTISQTRPAVPETVAQGDSYFSRDSIGSAKFDSRMDFPTLSSNATVLDPSMNEAEKSIGLSPQRPTLLASVDLFNSPGTSSDRSAQGIEESLEVAELESRLLAADYDYVYNSLLESPATTGLMKVLEETASSDLEKTKESVAGFLSLSAARENFSRNLDIRTSWDNVGQRMTEYYSTFSTKFGTGEIDTDLSVFDLNPKLDTGTGIVRKIQSIALATTSEGRGIVSVGKVKVGLSRGYFDVDNRVKSLDLLFDDGTVGLYSSLSRLQKLTACSEFLSRVLTDTFTGMTGSAKIDLPTSYNGGNIFEAQKVSIGNTKVPSHYDTIIEPAIKNLSAAGIEDFRSKIVKSYTDSYESAQMKTGVGNANEAGSSLDICLRLFGKVKDSFPTLYASTETSIISNPGELYDAVNLLFSMKQRSSAAQFNGFMRGTLLTLLLDPKYEFITDSGEEYDSVTETKSKIEDTGVTEGSTSRTLSSRTGNKSLATKSISETDSSLVQSIFSDPERAKNFPKTSWDYTKSLLKNVETPSRGAILDTFGKSLYFYPSFSPDSERTPLVSTAPEYEGFGRNAPKASSIPSAIKGSLRQGDSYDILQNNFGRISQFGRDDTGKTVANAITDLYNELISVFEETYGKPLEEVSPQSVFYTREGTCTKRGIIDVILECMGNLVAHFLAIGYANEATSTGTSTLSSTKGGGSTSPSSDSSAFSAGDSSYYIGLNESFYESLSFCESLSQLKGDVSTAISTSYSDSGLSKTSNSSFLADVLSSLRDDLYTRHKSTRVAISGIAAISKVVDTSSQEFASAISAAAKKMTGVSQRTKNDLLSSLTTEVVSAVSLKEKTEYGVREPLEGSLTVYDVSAARWFYSRYRNDLSSDKTCLVVGLPSGFLDSLARSEIKSYGIGTSVAELSLNRSLSKYRLLVSARSIQRPYESLTPLVVGKFHPLLHAYVANEIAENLLPLTLASSGAVKLLCFDRVSASWIETDYDDCSEFLSNGGNFGVAGYSESLPNLPKSEVEDVIEFHVTDAILKAAIRVVSGLNFDQRSLCLSSRSISPASASSLLKVISASGNLFTRGSLTAPDFLRLGEDGNYYPIPFSSLSGESPGLTKPGDHSLLLELLSSGVFTASTSMSRILTSPPFERVYCTIYDPNDNRIRTLTGNYQNFPSAREVSLISTNVTVE